jgi:hypothetical protein
MYISNAHAELGFEYLISGIELVAVLRIGFAYRDLA